MRPHAKKDLSFLFPLSLSGIAGLLYFAIGAGNWHFSSYQPWNESIFYSPTTVAFVAAIAILADAIIGGKQGSWARTAIMVFSFLLLVQDTEGAILILVLQLALFILDRRAPLSHTWNSIFVLSGLALLLLPVFLLLRAPGPLTANLGAVAVFREAFTLRIFSWIIFRRVYLHRTHGSFSEYLDYFFSPAFFLLPCILNLVSFSYFHETKIKEKDSSLARNDWLLGLWGLALMLTYSLFRNHYFDTLLSPYLWNRGVRLDAWFLLGGFCSFILIILHHTGAMAFQVSLARFLGHKLRYDMCYPLLSRSPMELWRREHNYTRQFLIENAIRPLTLLLMRRKVPKAVTFFLSAVFAYLILSFSLAGWKPFSQENTTVTTLAMTLVFSLSILAPVLLWLNSESLRTRSRFVRILAGIEELTPLRKWKITDYVCWAITLLMVSAAKAGVGSIRLLFP